MAIFPHFWLEFGGCWGVAAIEWTSNCRWMAGDECTSSDCSPLQGASYRFGLCITGENCNAPGKIHNFRSILVTSLCQIPDVLCKNCVPWAAGLLGYGQYIKINICIPQAGKVYYWGIMKVDCLRVLLRWFRCEMGCGELLLWRPLQLRNSSVFRNNKWYY